MNAIGRSIIHPLILKYSKIPFYNQQKYVGNFSDESHIFISCTNNENEDVKIIIKFLFLSIPGSILLVSLLCLTIVSMSKPLKNV